ncbi:MAG: hypothetical protein J6S71_06310 [Clostridia bacterium]|nr:hypothetical protein [Clostridia bacterium]
MMKNFLIRATSFLLLTLMLLGAVACAQTQVDQPDDGTTDPIAGESQAEVTEAETTAVSAENILGPRDFGGETLTFYSRKYNGAWSSDLLAPQEDGTILNDSIYKRNERLSAMYKINFAQIESGKRDCANDAINLINAGDTEFQAMYMGLSDAANMAQKGYLLDITELSNINLEGQWWTQATNKAWSIGNRQYFATGAITVVDDQAIRTMFFNKDIIAQYNLKTIYDLVYDNEWVFDKFFEYVEIAKQDNGDGKNTVDDTFGCAAQTTLGFMMTMGSGEMLASKDADDYPIIVASTNADRFISVVDYLSSKIAGNEGIYQGDDTVIREIFGNGRSLFYAEVLMHAQTMRQGYDIAFGIVPMPKYNSDQENYYQYSTGRNTTVICFPHTAKGDALDMATFMVEAMAIESVETVTPAYYEICLKGRYADDAESAAMLDIVTASVATDFAEIFGWASFNSTIQSAISAGTPISSILKKNAAAAEKIMKNTINDFQKLN